MSDMYWKRLIPSALALSLAGVAPAFGGDFSPIQGHWSSVREKCTGSDDFWEINKSGASGIEELCTVMSATRKGNRYILKQNCAVEGMEMIRTDIFRLLSPGQLEKGGRKYRRCPTPS